MTEGEPDTSADIIEDNPTSEYIFPPFPHINHPEGKTVMPFKDFKASGIQRPAPGFTDGVERDGLGIPTIQLKVDRSNNDEHLVKKKRRRNKKKGAQQGIVRDGQRLTWYEEWAENEESRTVGDIDL